MVPYSLRAVHRLVLLKFTILILLLGEKPLTYQRRMKQKGQKERVNP